jgi:replicative DNA helicase
MANKFRLKKYNTVEKMNIEIDENLLARLIDYVIIENHLITKKALNKLREFLDLVDEKKYMEDNINKYMYLILVKFLLNIRIEDSITNIDIFHQQIKDNLSEYTFIQEIFDATVEEIDNDEYYEITEDEIIYINKFVEQKLTFSYMYKYRDKFQTLFNNLDNVTNMKKLVQDFTDLVNSAYVDIREAKAESKDIMSDFNLADEVSAKEIIHETIKEYNKPNNKLLSGLKGLNEMLNGGFENQRFYLICGLPKSFKSGLLLQIALWGCKCNRNFTLKDPKRIPTVFYLTQENSVRETINRIICHFTGSSIKDLTTDEAYNLLKELVYEAYGVNLILKYRRTKSISTLDFDGMIDDIEADGIYEVILAIQDYTKRIKSSSYYPGKELRFELGDIADDFCGIAKERNIPIVSAAQFNRVAYAEVEKLIKDKKRDLIKNLNTSHIGESVGLIENPDYAILVNKEDVKDNDDVILDSYLTVKLLTSRDEKTGLTYFVQHFENGMKLEEDWDLTESKYILNLGDELAKNLDNNQNSVLSKNKISSKKLNTRKIGSKRIQEETVSSVNSSNNYLDNIKEDESDENEEKNLFN